MDDDAIVFGRVPGQNIVALRERLHVFVQALQGTVGCPIRLRVPASYDRVLEEMIDDKLDFVLVGPELWLQSVDAGAEYDLALRPIRAGSRSYRGQIITRTESSIHEVADLRDRSLALVNRQSVAGYIAALALLRLNKMELDSLGYRRFLGSHENVLRAVVDGRFDAGATFEGAEHTMSREGLDLASPLRVVTTTDPIPNEPLVFSRRFRRERPEVARRLEDALLTMHERPEGRAALRSIREGIQRFERITEPREYDTVRHLLLPGRPRISMIPGASMAGMRASLFDDLDDLDDV